MFNTVVGLVLLIVVLVGVVGRPCAPWWPHGMPVFVPAAVGAVCAVIFGLVGFPMLVTIVGRVWDASFTLIGLIMLAAALETNRFFEWAALRLARVAGGY